MAGSHATDARTEALLVETRRRAGRINRYVDMIPARFYLSSEALQAHKPRTGLDPAQYKPTSELLVEVLRASAEASAGSSQGSSSMKKKAKKQLNTPVGDVEASSSSADLRKKLERRIGELKEERKRKQSEKDRAKHVAEKTKSPAAAEAKHLAEKGAKHVAEKATNNNHGREEKEADLANPKKQRRSEATTSVGEDDVEAGRLSFVPKTSDLPFEARVNSRGHKVRELRTALRKEEGKKRQLDGVDDQEEREEMRKNFAMDAAMRRARGEKVHDDVGRLRKAQKMLETRKSKGKEKWDARVEINSKLAQEVQSKRKDNLKNRRSSKKDAAKARAGFEGKKSGYLNEEA